MKKVNFLIVILIFILGHNSYAISSNFDKIIRIMDIEKYNVNGQEINEYIYYTYNQIVYGDPESAINEPTQRWKSVDDGRWIRNGEKGEYRLLGYNYSGNVVNNHEFPMDVVPSSDPTEWVYVELEDASASWNDNTQFKYKEQKQYMQESNLMRNDILYNINCNKIGLNKTRVDSAATWSTKGIVYTNRLDPYGKRWEATFVVNPIATDITFKNNIKGPNYVPTFYKSDLYLEVQMIYVATVSNVNKYINENQIKRIESTIYVNGGKEKTFTTQKTLSQQGIYNVKIYRSDIGKNLKTGTYTIPIQIRSKLYTNFMTDAPLYAKKDYNLKIEVRSSNMVDDNKREKLNEQAYERPDIEIPEIVSNIDLSENDTEIELGRVIKENNNKYVEQLNKTDSTQDADSFGFISAGYYMGIKVKPEEGTYKVIAKIQNKEYEMINTGNSFYLEYLVPLDEEQTLDSWNTIRNKYGDSFNIDESLLMNRIKKPYNIEFSIYILRTRETEEGTETYTVIKNRSVKYDVFEKWTNLYNRNINLYILNPNKEKVLYEEWT